MSQPINQSQLFISRYIHKLSDSWKVSWTPAEKHRLLKASMEFVLYCYVLANKSILTSRYIKTLNAIEFSLKQNNSTAQQSFGATHLLEMIPGYNSNANPTELAELIALIALIDRKSLLMEVAFLLEIYNQNLSSNYWEVAAIKVINESTKTGMDYEGFYQMTHVIMFAAQFGKRNLSDVLSEKTIKMYIILLSKVELYAKNTEYWDLLIEIYISQIFIYENYADFDLIDVIRSDILNIPSINGFFFPFGRQADVSFASINVLEDTSYHIYHTNLVKCILDFVIAGCLSSK